VNPGSEKLECIAPTREAVGANLVLMNNPLRQRQLLDEHIVVRYILTLPPSENAEKGMKMAKPTQPLRDEHKEFFPHIEGLRAAADSVGEAPVETVRRKVGESHEFLLHHLLPHARAEERAFYPVVAMLIGAPEATATMRRDHVEIVRGDGRSCERG
jgi:hypothetical protein